MNSRRCAENRSDSIGRSKLSCNITVSDYKCSDLVFDYPFIDKLACLCILHSCKASSCQSKDEYRENHVIIVVVFIWNFKICVFLVVFGSHLRWKNRHEKLSGMRKVKWCVNSLLLVFGAVNFVVVNDKLGVRLVHRHSTHDRIKYAIAAQH